MANGDLKLESKPGYKTTEFWIAIVSQLIGVLSLLGIFTPEQSEIVNKAIIELGGLIVMAAGAFGYSIGRGIAKSNVDPNEGTG